MEKIGILIYTQNAHYADIGVYYVFVRVWRYLYMKNNSRHVHLLYVYTVQTRFAYIDLYVHTVQTRLAGIYLYVHTVQIRLARIGLYVHTVQTRLARIDLYVRI